MKIFQRIIYALLFSAILTLIFVLVQESKDGNSEVMLTAATGERSRAFGHSNGAAIREEIAPDIGRAPRRHFSAIQMADESASEIDLDGVASPVSAMSRTRSSRMESPGLDELIAEADRVVSQLCRDGFLMVPASYACAFTDPAPNPGTGKTLLDRFRRMHQTYDRVSRSEVLPGDQDAAIARGWSEIRIDLGAIESMAATLRSECSPATGKKTASRSAYP